MESLVSELLPFNPKSRDQNGEMTALQPLRTEGQGLTYNHPFWGVVEGPKQYKRVAVAIPIGGGLKIPLIETWA